MSKYVGMLVTLVMLLGCTAQARQTAVKSVNEAARAACEAAFGEGDQDLQGLTPQEVCAVHANVYPFVKAIVGARQEVLESRAPEPVCKECECEECSCPQAPEPEPTPTPPPPEQPAADRSAVPGD